MVQNIISRNTSRYVDQGRRDSVWIQLLCVNSHRFNGNENRVSQAKGRGIAQLASSNMRRYISLGLCFTDKLNVHECIIFMTSVNGVLFCLLECTN